MDCIVSMELGMGSGFAAALRAVLWFYRDKPGL